MVDDDGDDGPGWGFPDDDDVVVVFYGCHY
jgi:hypothetical protein